MHRKSLTFTVFRLTNQTMMPNVIPFYLKDWVDDDFIKKLDNELLGAYWRLLIYQATRGAFTDREAIDLLKLDRSDSYGENLWNILKIKFNQQGELRLNAKMDQSIRVAENHANRKRMEITRTITGSNNRSVYNISDIQIEEIFKVYPKRTNPRDGRTNAVKLLKMIVKSDDDVENIKLAAENYGKYIKNNYSRSDQAQYTKRIDGWLEVWQDWIPEKTETVKLEKPVFNSFEEESNWMRANGQLESYPPGSRFPWEPRYGASKWELEQIAVNWPENKRKSHLKI